MTTRHPGEIKEDYEVCLGVIAAYASGMFEAAGNAGCVLGLTYKTADNIMKALNTMWFAGDYPDYRTLYDNRPPYVKCLASYLILLALNEEELQLAIGYVGEDEIDDNPTNIPLDTWCGVYKLLLCKDISESCEDILEACIEGMVAPSEKYCTGIVLDAAPIIGAYKNITGVDLSEYGFRSKRFGVPTIYS